MSNDDARVVGARIRNLRVLRGLSQDELVGEEYSASYLSRIESGGRPAGPAVLAVFARRLGTTVEHLQTGVDPDAARDVELTVRYAELALRTGEPDHALQQFGQVLAGLIQPQQADLQRRALLGRAQAREATGDLEAALDDFHKVSETSVVGSGSWVDSSLGLLRCYRQVGDLTKSVELGEAALAQLRAQGSWPTPDAVRLLCTLQAAYHERGDLHYAKRVATEALSAAEQLADKRALASALWEASMLNADLGAVVDAVTMAERALAHMVEVAAERDTARLKVALAGLYREDGRPQDALDLLDAARNAQNDINVAGDGAFWLHEHAKALLDLGDAEGANRDAREALSALGDGPRLYTADVALTLGRVARAQGSPDTSDWFRRAAQVLVAVGNGSGAARIWVELGGELDAVGDIEGARDAYRAAAWCSKLSPAAAPQPQP